MLGRLQKAKARLLLVVSVALLLSLLGENAYASTSDSYGFSFWGNTVVAPPAYEPTALITGADLGTGTLKDPGDIFVSANNQVYIADSGNNRILVLTEKFELIQIIDSFTRAGQQDTFSNPMGIFVTDQNHLYVADTGNKRVVHLDEKQELVKLIDNPESEILQETFQFQPMRLIVDKAQRTYVMATGVFDGLMEFNSEGVFTSFMGANKVNVDPIDYFWKQISTREQKSQMVMYTPTEFTSLDIDEEGFIFTTNADEWGDMIKKLNAQGTDILRRTANSKPQGDIRYFTDEGPSRIIDIEVLDSEMFAVLDAKRGRIFTYDGDGNLLYVFGGIGNRVGEFNTPIAIARIGESFLVLDKMLGEVTVFDTTEYGRTLNEAVRSYYKGHEEEAFELFSKVIQMNANMEYAYTGRGKALLRQGDYSDSMREFKLSLDQANYSKAFLLFRKQVLREHFATIMTTIVLLVAAGVVVSKMRKSAQRKRGRFI